MINLNESLHLSRIIDVTIELHSSFYKNNFITTKALILAKNLRTSYSKVPNNRAPPLIIFGKIFRTLPLLLEPSRLLIFDY